MTQNIIDVSFDIEKFTAQQKVIYDGLLSIYDKSKGISGNIIAPGSSGGWTELTAKVNAHQHAISALQTANVKYTQTVQQVEKNNILAAKAAEANAKAIKAEEAAEQQRLKTQAQQLELTKKQIAANEKAAKAYNPANVPLVVTPINNDELKNATILVNEVDQAEAAAALSAAEFGNSVNKSTTALNDQGIVAKKVNSESIRDKEVQKQLERQANQELKNSVREQLAAKGSLEQRRAALIRLNAAYDNLNATERNSPYGIRLQKTIAGVITQVKELEYATGRAQRNVGNYGSAFEGGFAKAGRAATRFYGILRKVAYVLPGIGISGIVGFLAQPIIDMTMKLLGLGEASEEVKKQQQDMEDAFKSAADSAATEISKVTVLKTVLDSENTTRAQKITALKDLKSVNTDYFGQLDIENGKVNGLENSYDAYIAKLLRSINIKANEEQLTAALKEQNEIIGKINQSRETGFKHTIANLTEYERRTAIAEFNLNFGQGKNGNKIITPQQDQLIVDLLNKKELVKKIMDDMKANIQDDFNPKPQKIKKDKTKAPVLESTKNELDLEFELYKIAQQRKIKLLDEEANDTKKSFAERIKFAEEYRDAEIELAKKTADHEIAADNEKLAAMEHNYKKLKNGTEKNNLLVEIENEKKQIKIVGAKYNDEIIGIEDALQKRLTEIDKEEAEKRKKVFEDEKSSIENAHEEISKAIEAKRTKEKADHDEALHNKKINKKKYDELEEKSTQDNNILQAKADLSKANGALGLAIANPELEKKPLDDYINDVVIAQNKLKSLQNQNDKTKLEKKKEEIDQIKEITQSAQDVINGIVDAGYQKQIESIQKIIDLNNERKDQEIKNIQESTLSNQEKAAQMMILDNTVAANNKKLEREKVAIQIKQAKYDRDASILAILENAAVGYFKLVAENGAVGLLEGAVLASTAAAQIAMLLAKPLPQMPAYAEGTNFHPGGAAIVGEKKVNGSFQKELITTPDGKSFITDKPTFIPDLLRGSKVTPLTKEMIMEGMTQSANISMAERIVLSNSIQAEGNRVELAAIKEAVYETGRMTAQALKKQKGANVTFISNGNWKEYIQRTVKE
jgi:hypothetical protein